MKRSSFGSNFRWIYFVAKRFSLVDLKGAEAFTSKLSTLGICFGVMTLIIVISVMNGFQREFIDAIMEISSYNVRAENLGAKEREVFEKFAVDENGIECTVAFTESESLLVSADGRQSAALVRAIETDVMEKDSGFAREAKIVRGAFDLRSAAFSESGEALAPCVLGITLARSLDVRVGEEVNFYATDSGDSLLEAFSRPQKFFVAGIFRTGYSDINSSYAFVALPSQTENVENLIYGIKTKNSASESALAKKIRLEFPDAKISLWKEYNRSFFGALRIEKNMLMLLVVLIFVVVAINIFNSMRRIVFERRFEISTMSALGAKISSVKNIFVMRGFLIGLRGAIAGLVLGLFFCVNIKSVFTIMSSALFYTQYFFVLIFSPQNAAALSENPMFAVYANIPARMYAHEIIFITLFGIFSAAFSAWAASREILNTSISEVLNEN
ncbi:MAG: ABC transporter permease [Treponemataceae bacterium]|nr:ABC transporter permease [Treponemataceae bacterium]